MKQFAFERVFEGSEGNEKVFEECRESIREVVSGGNVCILAYGQTGSGKTHTMQGCISLSLHHLFTHWLKDTKAEVNLQCLEVYNEQVRDLLTQESENRVGKLQEFLTKTSVYVGDRNEVTVFRLIEQAISFRTTKYTEGNERSSRSHLILTILIRNGENTGKLQFVDLAGSERLSTSNVKGDVLKETLAINKSLTALQDVIAALECKSSHIPYRNSLLTVLLQPVFAAPASKLVVVFNVAPGEEHVAETVGTLALGVRLKSVELTGNIRDKLKNRQVERTFSLLEKEREEKFLVLRVKDKLERDLSSYSQALKDKDNKLSLLSSRLKQLEKEHFESTARLKREVEEHKQQLATVTRKLRQSVQSGRSDAGRSEVQLTERHSPKREVLGQTKMSQARLNAVGKHSLTPNMKKAKTPIPRPQSVSKVSESRNDPAKRF